MYDCKCIHVERNEVRVRDCHDGLVSSPGVASSSTSSEWSPACARLEVIIVILVLLIIRHYKYYSGVLGVTLSLRGNSIPIDGSGRIIITDINPDGYNNEDALICLSERSGSIGDWFLHPTQQTTEKTTDGSVRIESTDSRGWGRNRALLDDDRRLVRLRRDDSAASGGRALEGVFTCDIPGDSNTSTPVSVGIYYPSESHVQSLIFTT